MFYRDLLDGMHCYLKHLKDYGFRPNYCLEKSQHTDIEYKHDKFWSNCIDKHCNDTFMDSLCAYLSKLGPDYHSNILIEEDYDTDAAQLDVVYYGDQSNIRQLLGERAAGYILSSYSTSNICF